MLDRPQVLDDGAIRAEAASAMDRGWSVFPVNGKIPATPNGCKDASRNFDLIESWWPEGASRGIAMATGAPSRIWVLDLDGREALDRFLDLQSELGKIPPTVTSRTARGFHIYFRMPQTGDVRSSAGRVAPGIDTRGTGGYIVLPPSPHPSGTRYQWAKGRGPEEVAPVLAPEWLLQLVQKTPAPPPPARLLPDAPRGTRYVVAAIEDECAKVASAPEGTRNEALNSAAFALSRFIESGDASPQDVARQLASAATRAGLPEEEIRRTILSAFRGRGVSA